MPRRSILSTLITLLALLSGVGAAVASAPPSGAAAERAPRREQVAACSWDRPGHNPFMGDVVAAVDRYSDIPTPVRVRLKQRMQARQYDEMVDIRRDSIRGKADYRPTIRDMHFGVDRVCAQVSRSGWTQQMHERGLVYCESGHCILVPTVCRNVSRIERAPAAVAGAPASDGGLDLAALPPTAAGPTAASSERFAGEPEAPQGQPGPQATSSFAEAVAGAALALFPLGDGGGPLEGLPGLGGAGSNVGSGANGGFNGGSLAGSPFDDGTRNGFLSSPPLGFPDGSFDAGGPPSGSVPTISAIPEPATWASLALGLGLVALASARRSGRRSLR